MTFIEKIYRMKFIANRKSSEKHLLFSLTRRDRVRERLEVLGARVSVIWERLWLLLRLWKIFLLVESVRRWSA